MDCSTELDAMGGDSCVCIDGSVTPKSWQAAIGLFHMGRSAIPTEEIQMAEELDFADDLKDWAKLTADEMEKHSIFAPVEAAPPSTALPIYALTAPTAVAAVMDAVAASMLPSYAPSAGEVDQWLTAPTAVADVMDAVAASMLPSHTAGVRDEELFAAAAEAAAAAVAEEAAAAVAEEAAAEEAEAAAAAAAAPAAAHAGVMPNMEGGVFIDKNGKRFTESQQKVSIKEWATKAETGGWLHPRGNAMKRFKALWSEHGRGSFNVKQLHYRDTKNIERYPSAKGFCNGSELKGFPLFVPTRFAGKKRRVIKDLRFYPLVADELEGGAKRSAAEIGGGGKRQCVASVQKV